jgi:hypothetical protein
MLAARWLLIAARSLVLSIADEGEGQRCVSDLIGRDGKDVLSKFVHGSTNEPAAQKAVQLLDKCGKIQMQWVGLPAAVCCGLPLAPLMHALCSHMAMTHCFFFFSSSSFLLLLLLLGVHRS